MAVLISSWPIITQQLFRSFQMVDVFTPAAEEHHTESRPPGIPVREFPGIRYPKNSRREFPGITEFSVRVSGSS